MTRAGILRLMTAVAILVGAALLALSSSPKLGLDLSGGTQIVLETSDSDTGVKADAEATDRTLEVLRGRVDALGVAEPTLVRSGSNRIIVELPGLTDPDEAAEVVGRTAQLSFHPVLGYADQEGKAGGKSLVLPDEDGTPLRLGPVALPGDQLSAADAVLDQTQWVVAVDFKGSGSQAWAELTGSAACFDLGDPRRRVAIVLDDEVISSPQVQDAACDVGMTGGSTQISGDFTADTAAELAVLIEGGALPVPVEIIEQRTVGPTLGADAIDASVKAGLIGLALTGAFIMFTYRLAGLLATFALLAYALISYAALTALGATLTLPGLAGFVLAIGMAIDANVLVFERAKDESGDAEAAGRAPNLPRSLAAGFKHAWTAIIDSNVTTLLAAGLLFLLASGPVRGFGVTLSIGVLASMVSALVIARVLTEVAMNRGWVRRHPKVSGLTAGSKVRAWLARRNPDLMSRSRMWLAVSGVALVVAVSGIVAQGLNLGVEFTGGRLMEYTTTEPVTVSQARAEVAEAGFPTAVVQASGEGVAVRTGQISNDEQDRITDALAEVGGTVTVERDELIGPSLGSELRTKALIAFGVALLLQMTYLAVRFRWVFGASAVAAMFHDVVIVVGVFAWLGKPIDGVFLAAALTIVGLSVNDSVVVFDRVRERWTGKDGRSFSQACNEAVLATVPRTINTGLGSMFILGALAVLGGSSLRDFAIALLIGLVVGTYSSMFTATPLAVVMHERWPVAPRSPRPPRSSAGRTPFGDRDLDNAGAVV